MVVLLTISVCCMLLSELPLSVKIIKKTYHKSSISQHRLDGLALLAIENECAKQLNIDDMIDICTVHDCSFILCF